MQLTDRDIHVDSCDFETALSWALTGLILEIL
jgi:hypothetical protein